MQYDEKLLIELYEGDENLKDIASKLDMHISSLSRKIKKLIESEKVKSRMTKKTRKKEVINNKIVNINKENVENITYKPPKLKTGKIYQFNEMDSNKRIKSNSKMKGKIIEEFDSFYRLDRGKYIECINKNCMMDLIIKEL